MGGRTFYTLATSALLPLAPAYLAWRARRQPEYLQHVGERYGIYRQAAPLIAPIWLHAVSVGETRAAAVLAEALAQRYPDIPLLITHGTPTGRATSQQLLGARAERAYLPYDHPLLVRRFLKHFRPRLGIVLETEIWPNLNAACSARGVPLLLVNARLSARSAARYKKFGGLARAAVAAYAAVGAQHAEDAARLTQLGAHPVSITGNLKFDALPPPHMVELGKNLRATWGKRPVVLAASTREGEEAALLDAFASQAAEEVLLVLVPRHPQRFDEVAALIGARSLSMQRRSEHAPLAPATRVLLGDSMGEMYAYYAAADVALIGGSWLPHGGQNLIEACAVGTPVVLGPHTFNFAQAAELAIEAGAALRARDAAAGIAAALELLADRARCSAMQGAGEQFAAAHRGATKRTLALIEAALGSARTQGDSGGADKAK
ncbi:MAG: lipid IV(A) 3-deoxy-D-manno-octulosonic acid transferase [Rhodocyclaceae bacterium]|nr:lipid IV(A) 3-deoxy-D-manno-octulosonic acid transferase [Rhodocyclaceae bacterium]